jgi:hypothetical protein
MLTIQSVKNLQWENEDHSYFSCMVKYDQFAEELPSGINGDDPTFHIREIWEKAKDGVYGKIAEYVYIAPPVPDVAPDQQPTVDGAQTL